MASYLPKATVQAAIGSVPLVAGLSCGNTVLSTAVVGIIITAPVGAFLIDFLSGRLLQRGGSSESDGLAAKTVNIHTIRKRQVPTTVQRAGRVACPEPLSVPPGIS